VTLTELLLLTVAVWALLGLLYLADRHTERAMAAAWSWWWRTTVLRDAERSVRNAASRRGERVRR
jgi:hypothetical protein